MKKFIIPSNWTTNFLPDFVNLDNWEQAREILISNIWKNLSWNTVTILDLFNLSWLESDEEIEQMLNTALTKDYCSESKGFDINSQEWLKRINKLLEESIRIYEDIFKRKYPERKMKTKFKSKKEVINFLKLTLKWNIKSEIICFISKIAYSINDILENPWLEKLDEKANFILWEKIIPWIQLDEIDFLREFWFWKGSVRIAWENIDFTLRYRWKSSDKSALKMINDPNYWYSELINDSIWIEFEVSNEKHAFLILNRFFVTLFYQNNNDWSFANFAETFKNKWLLSLEWLEKLLKNKDIKLNKEFIEYIQSAISNKNTKDKNNKQYQDAKFIWKVKIPKNLNQKDSQLESHSVELRVVFVWNENEEWLSDHRILDTLKIIFWIIRISWYIRINEIKKLINILLEENPDLIEEKWLNYSKIFNYYIEEKLLKVKIWNKIMYTTKNRYKTMNNTDFYPENIKKI